MLAGEVRFALGRVSGTATSLPAAMRRSLVVAGFEPITADNRLVLVQEWLAEAFTMWGVAAAVVVTTAVAGADAEATVWLYRVEAGLLVALAALTAFTGARTPVIWFKICPFLLGNSAALLVVASLV